MKETATSRAEIVARLKEIETFVLNGLEKIQERLAGEIHRAKAELAKHRTFRKLATRFISGQTRSAPFL
jgi:hypothetical protein